MENFFEAPPEGTLQIGYERPLKIEYKSMKIPDTFAKDVNGEKLAEFATSGKVGFSYYVKETGETVSMSAFSFVILEGYAGVSGRDFDQKISYWSNRVKDSRHEEMVVFASNHEGIMFCGKYGKGGFIGSEKLPNSATYTKFIRAYCLEMDKVVEIELTAAAERGMQKAVAEADAANGKKKADWQKVFVLSLADNDHLWGFALNGYTRDDKEGNEYAGKGDLYFAPAFRCGIVNPAKQPALDEKCYVLRQAELKSHRDYQAKYATAVTTEPTPTPEMKPAIYPAPAYTSRQEPAPQPVTVTDDLPF